MAFETLLARLTAQSNGPNPKIPGGGVPKYTAADISLIASHAPHMSFHALMTKNCQDMISAKQICNWTHDTSLTEWFLSGAYENTPITPGQINRLVELSILAWAVPHAKEAKTKESRARFVKCAEPTYRRKYDWHFSFLTRELSYLENVGDRAISQYLRPTT